MSSEVVIIGQRMEDLIAVSTRLRPGTRRQTLLQTRDVVRSAQRVVARAPGALVLFLTERDNLADLRTLLASTEARVLMIAPQSPPHASLARLAAEYEAGICGKDDATAVREAMLVALIAQPAEASS
ncbi:MAG: hypothetical protein WEE64_06985 [Dehalococcoidia bacterium]